MVASVYHGITCTELDLEVRRNYVTIADNKTRAMSVGLISIGYWLLNACRVLELKMGVGLDCSSFDLIYCSVKTGIKAPL